MEVAYNQSIHRFPNSVVVVAFSFQSKPFFQATATKAVVL
ncbi:MAG TPA: hypothetical protein DEV81_19260 [Cyanobacteria bacterium UBA11049]|nr:hypothetical protein [Cyanobacteria bacterium UBA11049]